MVVHFHVTFTTALTIKIKTKYYVIETQVTQVYQVILK